MNREDHRSKAGKRLPVWSLILIDVIGTCLALSVFMFFHLILPRIREEKNLQNSEPALIVSPSESVTASSPATVEIQDEPADDWKFAYLTTDEIVVTPSSYSSHGIYHAQGYNPISVHLVYSIDSRLLWLRHDIQDIPTGFLYIGQIMGDSTSPVYRIPISVFFLHLSLSLPTFFEDLISFSLASQTFSGQCRIFV